MLHPRGLSQKNNSNKTNKKKKDRGANGHLRSFVFCTVIINSLSSETFKYKIHSSSWPSTKGCGGRNCLSYCMIGGYTTMERKCELSPLPTS